MNPVVEPTSTPRATEPTTKPRPQTLRDIAIAAIAAATLPPPPAESDEETPELQFLRRHLQRIVAGNPFWARSLPDSLKRPLSADAPLVEMAQTLGLSMIETLTVALAAAVEDDLMLGRALAHLQMPTSGSRPTLGLLTVAFEWLDDAAFAGHGGVLDQLSHGMATRTGLLQFAGDQLPRPERAVAVPTSICLALRGSDASWPGASIGVGDNPVVLPASARLTAQSHAAALKSGPDRGLVIRCGSKTEAKALAGAVSEAIGLRPIFLESPDTTGLTPLLLLRRLLPVYVLDVAPGDRKSIPSIVGYRGPVVILTGPDGSVQLAGGDPIEWRVAAPSQPERRELWNRVLGNNGPLADELSRHHRHGTGRIAQVGHLAKHHAVLGGRTTPHAGDVMAASGTTEGAGLDGLAGRVNENVPDEALITSPTLRRELDTLLLRCRQRDGLVSGLGPSSVSRYRPGVRALFVGPSGTGKTLAAGWIAGQLRLPLFRVDVAATTSKWIGETEKNLATLLARAEHAEVILLFDEADSYFARRTEVDGSNDRFANNQTNYLLQRIESFEGYAILTSNSRNRFDPAFTRRLDAIVEFAMPGPEERRALWQSHLGTQHAVSVPDLNRLAAAGDVAGGQIRNATLTAAVVAGSQSRPICYADLAAGLAGEYRKLNRPIPAEIRLGDASRS